jgi:TolB-like protein
MRLIAGMVITLGIIAAPAEDATVNDVAKELAAASSRNNRAVIAVLPLDAIGFADEAYGPAASDRLMAAVVRQGSVTVVERDRLDRILKEKELTQTGLIEQDDIRAVGKLLAVDAIVSGRVYRTEKGAELNVRLVDAATGKILAMITRAYAYTAPAAAGRSRPWYAGSWRVVATAPYLEENGMRYEKLTLGDDDRFALVMENNNGTMVEIQGRFRVNGNAIDYFPERMLFDGKPTSFQRTSRSLEGSLYLVNGKMFFNYTNMDKTNRARLDAMNARFRCVAERQK